MSRARLKIVRFVENRTGIPGRQDLGRLYQQNDRLELRHQRLRADQAGEDQHCLFTVGRRQLVGERGAKLSSEHRSGGLQDST